MKGRGCSECRYSGYRGRIAIFEILVLNEFVRNAILARKTSHEIREVSMKTTGFVTLLEHGIAKAASGITTVDELARCLPRQQQPRQLAEIKRLLGE